MALKRWNCCLPLACLRHQETKIKEEGEKRDWTLISPRTLGTNISCSAPTEPGSPQEKENSFSLSPCAESRSHIFSSEIAIGDLISENVAVVLEGSG